MCTKHPETDRKRSEIARCPTVISRPAGHYTSHKYHKTSSYLYSYSSSSSAVAANPIITLTCATYLSFLVMCYHFSWAHPCKMTPGALHAHTHTNTPHTHTHKHTHTHTHTQTNTDLENKFPGRWNVWRRRPEVLGEEKGIPSFKLPNSQSCGRPVPAWQRRCK